MRINADVCSLKCRETRQQLMPEDFMCLISKNVYVVYTIGGYVNVRVHLTLFFPRKKFV